jgi:hypothetical protein
MLVDVTARLRPRTGWESQDLGLTMTRHLLGRILGHWLVLLVPLWALLGFLLWDHPGWWLVICWWLKPVYDRIPLFLLGRKLFGQETRLRDTVREFPRLFFIGNVYFLTIARFSFYRCFSMPVKILEGAKYRDYRRRFESLVRLSDSTVLWVTIAWFMITWLGVIGLYLLVQSWIVDDPMAQIQGLWSQLMGNNWIGANLALWRWVTVLYLIVTTLTEPFYMGSGFGLYLNSRSHLEGWDIEISFRALANRLRVQGSLIALATGISLLFAFQSPVMASDEVRQIITEVKQHEDFKIHSETREVVVSSGTSGPNFEAPLWDIAWLDEVGTVIFYLLVGGMVVWLGWLIYRNRHLFKWKQRTEDKVLGKATVIMGLNVAAEELPTDIPGAAWKAWEAGQIHQALRLLYAGSLSWMLHRGGLPIRESDTEGDCLRHSKTLPDGSQRDYFQGLTQVWIGHTYGKSAPLSPQMEHFVRHWPFPA